MENVLKDGATRVLYDNLRISSGLVTIPPFIPFNIIWQYKFENASTDGATCEFSTTSGISVLYIFE